MPYAVGNDALGFGLEVEIMKAQLPTFTQWQHFQAGQYAFGVEPGTNHVKGHAFARERGELIRLKHGEERAYDLSLRVLDGAEAIEGAARRIRAIAGQPDEDYPAPSEVFKPLRRSG